MPQTATHVPDVGTALDCHRRGELDAAAELYKQILSIRPDDFDALHLLGVLAAQSGSLLEAKRLITSATLADPDNPAMYAALGNLGSVQRRLGEIEPARACYQRALQINPAFVEGYVQRARLALSAGEPELAESDCDAALKLRPDHGEVLFFRANARVRMNRLHQALQDFARALTILPELADAYLGRGNLLLAMNRPECALQDYHRAIELRPADAEAHCSLGNALAVLRRWDAALSSYDQAVELRPDFAEVHCNRGNALLEMVRLPEAAASFERAIALKPEFPAAHCNRGNALLELRHFEAAVISHDTAIALRPEFPEAFLGRANALVELRRMDEAIASYDRAISLREKYAYAYIRRAQARLLSGDLARGWRDFEWRWRYGDDRDKPLYGRFDALPWLGGESLQGKRILLHAEQGFGDTIQFSRYVELVADLGATVILEAPRELCTLLASLRGVDEIVPRGTALPSFDYHCPLMSLPLAFNTTLECVPAKVPYLRPELAKVREWSSRLGPCNRPRVGIAWSGNFVAGRQDIWPANHRRNVPLEKLAALCSDGVEFHSLQKGEPARGEWARLRAQGWNGIEMRDHADLLQDFSDTAALVANMDLVISADTSVAHLAGALGKPLWLLNRFDGCWRWLLDRFDSPWYPTARIYRQPRDEDWDSVLRGVAADLRLRFRTHI
jgi:tetratricopeptide (TPR) repeat protein